MSSRVRLLPALIGAAGVLMVLRVGAIASAAEEAKKPEAEAAQTHEAAPAADAAAQPVGASPEVSPEVKTAEATALPASDGATATPVAPPVSAGFAQTKGEAQVLEDLAERRAALDARERDLAMREQLMGVTEKRVAERVAELKDLETRLNALLAQRDEQEEVQLASLVKTYEAMKPADAAKIFNKLDRTVLLNVASRMKPAKIGAVLAAMDPARAQDLTVMLAKRMSVTKPVAAVAPAAVPAPVPAPAAAEAPVQPLPIEQPQAAAPVAPTPAEAPHG